MQKGLIVHTVISNSVDEVLILHRSKENDILPGYWDIPGGTLADGEDPDVGATREVKEETGLDVSGLKLFFQKSNVDVSKNKQFVTLVFHTKIFYGKVVINFSEHDDFIWVKPADIGLYKVVDYIPDCLIAYDAFSTKVQNQ